MRNDTNLITRTIVTLFSDSVTAWAVKIKIVKAELVQFASLKMLVLVGYNRSVAKGPFARGCVPYNAC